MSMDWDVMDAIETRVCGTICLIQTAVQALGRLRARRQRAIVGNELLDPTHLAVGRWQTSIEFGQAKVGIAILHPNGKHTIRRAPDANSNPWPPLTHRQAKVAYRELAIAKADRDVGFLP